MTQAEQWITRSLGDQRTVTFRELSRSVGCHVHAAKNHLADYLSTHPNVAPTYLLSGPLLSTSTVARTALSTDAPTPTQSLAHMSATQKLRIVDMDQVSDDERNSEADEEEERAEIALEESGADEGDVDLLRGEQVNKWGVVLVGHDKMEDKKKLFEHASIHIYALSPVLVKDPAQFLTCAANVREHGANPNLYGTITGTPLGTGTKPMRDGGMDFGKKTAFKKEPEAKKEVARKDVKKKEPIKPEINEEAKKLGPRKSSSNKRRIVLSDDDDEDDAPSPAAASIATKGSASTSSSRKLQPTSSMVRADDQAALEAMMGMDVDFDDELGTATKSPVTTSTSADTKSNNGEGRKRKTRRVKKSKVEMDDKGYMVTRDYYTDESCSGSDTDTTAPATKRQDKDKAKPVSSSSKPGLSKPKAQAPLPTSGGGSKTKKGPSKPAPMGQSTLAGFFKKK